MGFAGLSKDKDRADIIAYLRTLSDSPKPLPEAGARGSGDGARLRRPPRQPACGRCPAR